jgi:hypothetical protein
MPSCFQFSISTLLGDILANHGNHGTSWYIKVPPPLPRARAFAHPSGLARLAMGSVDFHQHDQGSPTSLDVSETSIEK